MQPSTISVDKIRCRKKNFTSRWETARINGPRIAVFGKRAVIRRDLIRNSGTIGDFSNRDGCAPSPRSEICRLRIVLYISSETDFIVSCVDIIRPIQNWVLDDSE